jgi:cysteinyl-tRNA synthetase
MARTPFRPFSHAAGEAGTSAVSSAMSALPSVAPGGQAAGSAGGALLGEAAAALADDLNTPAVLAALSGPLRTINELLTTKAGRKRSDRWGGFNMPGPAGTCRHRFTDAYAVGSCRLAVLAQLHVAMGHVFSVLGVGPESAQRPDMRAAVGAQEQLQYTRAGLEALLQVGPSLSGMFDEQYASGGQRQLSVCPCCAGAARVGTEPVGLDGGRGAGRYPRAR